MPLRILNCTKFHSRGNATSRSQLNPVTKQVQVFRCSHCLQLAPRFGQVFKIRSRLYPTLHGRPKFLSIDAREGNLLHKTPWIAGQTARTVHEAG